MLVQKFRFALHRHAIFSTSAWRSCWVVIHGRNDRFLLASGHARNGAWAQLEPQTVMLDAGHFVHQERPEAVNRALIRWLSDTP